MIVWCSYCQKFLKEKPPYDQFQVSHGVCPSCMANALTLSQKEYQFIARIGNICYEAKLIDLRGSF